MNQDRLGVRKTTVETTFKDKMVILVKQVPQRQKARNGISMDGQRQIPQQQPLLPLCQLFQQIPTRTLKCFLKQLEYAIPSICILTSFFVITVLKEMDIMITTVRRTELPSSLAFSNLSSVSHHSFLLSCVLWSFSSPHPCPTKLIDKRISGGKWTCLLHIPTMFQRIY